MKRFIASLVILAALVILIIMNSRSITNITEELGNRVSTDNPAYVKEFWDEKYDFLSISIHQKLIREADKALIEAVYFEKTGMQEDSIVAFERFKSCLYEIEVRERLRIENFM